MTVSASNRIIQIHPSRQCNLQCLHCYSSSGPKVKDFLPVDILEAVITEASQEGYSVASFSGGEPLLYDGLIQLMDHAHARGMTTAMVTNGILLTENRLAELKGSLYILAISLDGSPETHNLMRNQAKAFERMASRLAALRESEIPFGFVFTVTKKSIQDFDWVLKFALDQGASLLQVHALEESGRAEKTLSGFSPDDSLASYTYLKVIRARKEVGDRLQIQVDLTHQQIMQASPASFYASPRENLDMLSLSDLVSPLIVETSGRVVPLEYGFGQEYEIGNIKHKSLSQLANQWKKAGYQEFLELCQNVFEELTVPQKLPIMDWYARISEQSQKSLVSSTG